MITSGTFAPDAGALSSLLDAGAGPVIVSDPCGTLWDIFRHTPRWTSVWQAWRLAPGQAQEGNVWDVLGALRQLPSDDGCRQLATALFPADAHSALTRDLMACVLMFADDTGHFTGRSAGLGGLAGQLWADDLWTAIARWSRLYTQHPSLQLARTLLTQDGAGESVRAIRERMATFHHPHVAESFAGGAGMDLRSFRQRPAQVIFLTPDIRCMESKELTDVYAFLLDALRALGALHHVTFSLAEPAIISEGDAP